MISSGTLLVVSGPSGSGKTTLCRRATEAGLCQYSISCTTRAPRPGENDGRDYHFLSMEEFERRAAQGEFLEHALVHGNRYGTLKADIVHLLRQGINVVMDIDVQGADQVRSCDHEAIRQAYADLFIHVPIKELETRLRSRETDSDEIIRERLENAIGETARLGSYEFLLVSSDRENDYARFSALLTALTLRTKLSGIDRK